MTTGTIEYPELEQRLLADLPDWQATANSIERCYGTTGWKSSLMLANTIGYLAEAAWHHPELVVNYDSVKVILTTHSEGGVTEKDLQLAKKIDAITQWPPQGEFQQLPEKYLILK